MESLWATQHSDLDTDPTCKLGCPKVENNYFLVINVKEIETYKMSITTCVMAAEMWL